MIVGRQIGEILAVSGFVDDGGQYERIVGSFVEPMQIDIVAAHVVAGADDGIGSATQIELIIGAFGSRSVILLILDQPGFRSQIRVRKSHAMPQFMQSNRFEIVMLIRDIARGNNDIAGGWDQCVPGLNCILERDFHFAGVRRSRRDTYRHGQFFADAFVSCRVGDDIGTILVAGKFENTRIDRSDQQQCDELQY